jgi:hypothetical protein
VERHPRDLRGRVKLARAVVSSTSGLAETLASDWTKAARFYARLAITETQFREGVPPGDCVNPNCFEGLDREPWSTVCPW